MIDRSHLIKRSIEIIEQNQSSSGAYVASPNFREYQYCWLRDSSFIGYAMLLRGRADSTEAFLRWAASAIERQQPHWSELQLASSRGTEPPEGAYFPTRFTLDGVSPQDDWPNFQIDGYGHWLWLLGEWLTAEKQTTVPMWAQTAVDASIRYLRLTWHLPNFDAWEEHGDKIHPATLASVYGGLCSMEQFGYSTSELASQVKQLALSELTADGALPKYLGSQAVDSSILWAAVPFRMLKPDAKVMVATASRVEQELHIGGGVVRYKDDTYYGGGRWILLTAWLGWYFVHSGRPEKADACLAWIEARTSETGELPEQVSDITNDPTMVQSWRDRWGSVAEPLLWSHAMYLVLISELQTIAGVAGDEFPPERRSV